MTDPQNIPYLIKLLDDDSLYTQTNVRKELKAFGPLLDDYLKEQRLDLSPGQNDVISRIIQNHKIVWITSIWNSWFDIEDESLQLEKALEILCEFLKVPGERDSLRMLLDALTIQFQSIYDIHDERHLAQFLFKDFALVGNDDDYYNMQNSNLVSVIKTKKGIPISLACIYMLVGRRVGLNIEGCHFPGHFLARIDDGGDMLFVDCFSSGQFITAKDILNISDERRQNLEEIIYEKASVETIVRRFLANLIRCCESSKEQISYEHVNLFKQLDSAISDHAILQITPDDIILQGDGALKAGEVVVHKRYGYRGIVVDVDPVCMATDSWYYGNQTQPEKDQPWLHILVDGTDQVTYVAQSNLELDDSKDKVAHPLLAYFFTESKSGEYLRNNNPWPETNF